MDGSSPSVSVGGVDLSAIRTQQQRARQFMSNAARYFQDVQAPTQVGPVPGQGIATQAVQQNTLSSQGSSAQGQDPFALIRGFESYRQNPYWDVNAYRGGWGSDTITTEDGRVLPVTPGMVIDQATADRDLARRVETEFRPSTIAAVGQERFNLLNPMQRQVLESLAYNYGAGAWRDDLSGVAHAVRQGGDVRGSILALGSHNNGINQSRREREASFF